LNPRHLASFTLAVLMAAAALASAPADARRVADPLPAQRNQLWDVATASSSVIGTSGPIYRFNVKTELGLGYDANKFAAEAIAILSDPRSWIGTGQYRFQMIPGGSAADNTADAGVDFTLFLASPATADRLCSPLRTVGRLSCRNGSRVVQNIDRWMRGPDVYHNGFEGALPTYRQYLINHEIGHRLGMSHRTVRNCTADLYAPVMMQQTFSVRGCAINGWPAYDLATVGNEPTPEPPQNSPPEPSGPCDRNQVFPWSEGARPLDDSVTRLYRAVFGEDLSQEQLTFWIGERAKGRSAQSVAATLLDIAKLEGSFNKLDDQSYVNQIYNNLLGRAPEANEMTDWLGLLAAPNSQAQVLVWITRTPGIVTETGTSPYQPSALGWISRLYEAVLDRQPDCNGARYWQWIPVERADVVYVFVGGPEFEARYGSTSDAEFVQLLYRNVLDREPDQGGKQYWTDQLAAGTTRAEVVITWISTPEFVMRTGTTP